MLRVTAAEARRWCVEAALPALSAGGDPTPWAEGLAAVAAAGEVGLVRPAVARALAGHSGHPAVLPALAAYVRAAPGAEALEFATDWAVDAWEVCCASRRQDDLPPAVALAGLTIAHLMAATSGPEFDRRGYNAAVQAMRDMLIRLARSAPQEGAAPRGLLSGLLAAAQARAAALGFSEAVAARIPSLVRICKDFGRSLPRGHPGLRYLA